METKIKLEFKAPKSKIIEHNGVELEINPMLLISEQIVLINRYIAGYFRTDEQSLIQGSEYDYVGAEYSLRGHIFQSKTNIETDGINMELYGDEVLWSKITASIVNYCEFREKLDHIVQEIKDQKILSNSLGSVISDLVLKAYAILEQFSNITPEQIEQAKKAGLELVKKLEESSIKDIVKNETLLPKKTRTKRTQ